MSKLRFPDGTKCYLCDADATTAEHVPPRCIFPEAKDFPGENYRKNLITVPSCEIHNTLKSKDDEYLLLILNLTAKKNSVGQRHLQTKIRRLIKRTPGLFSKMDTTGKKSLYRLGSEKKIQLGHQLKIDINRYQQVLVQISYGLYLATFKKKFLGQVGILINGLNYFDPSKKEWDIVLENAVTEFNGFFSLTPDLGENPKIFTYNFSNLLSDKIFLRMKFHEFMVIVAIFEGNPGVFDASK